LKKYAFIALALLLSSCATTRKGDSAANTEVRTPATAERTSDLSGTYLGEAIFKKSRPGVDRPAMRLYLDKVPGESDSYYGVLLEYYDLLRMAIPFVASQKDNYLNTLVDDLEHIATDIRVFKLVPGSRSGTYDMDVVFVDNGRLAAGKGARMTLTLDPNNKTANPLAGASINRYGDGKVVFPIEKASKDKSFLENIDVIPDSQYEMARLAYSKGKLSSTWRGNWTDLEGSYLSAYGRLKDGVLELSTVNGEKRAKFVKTNRTHARNFTNPISQKLEGEYIVTEPAPKIYILTPANPRKTESEKILTPLLGLFLDVFDASAPEAGGKKVTEIAFSNPWDPEDFLMYYQHPGHAKNIGVEPAKKKD
jgi:hypothetical protein